AMAEVSASDAPTEGTKYGSGSSTGAPDYPHGTRRDHNLALMFCDPTPNKLRPILTQLLSLTVRL
ncbi:hypothetical protein, partial [Roseovarius sp. D0-M9]|uniref:hypothetical protein n=1 Tax=Roseovarius sp. D0-M9 TaxID=3127117 RepID=UPI0030101527